MKKKIELQENNNAEMNFFIVYFPSRKRIALILFKNIAALILRFATLEILGNLIFF